ncbi:hypothetical protein LEP1GSC161_1637 [Leptospira santarosai str. CBC1416]|uniref:Uncharacterized protein n=1 Tax=Leptospira santarosai str. CBC1416 TaxID=1193059 RepID=M6VRD1_9LEPT|nr:hypothetical protein LEP1GSC161_1637 [Leptospira santarosai str. CBC1416]
MELDFLRSDLILFNYYSFGSLLVTITTFFSPFFSQFKKKDRRYVSSWNRLFGVWSF